MSGFIPRDVCWSPHAPPASANTCWDKPSHSAGAQSSAQPGGCRHNCGSPSGVLLHNRSLRVEQMGFSFQGRFHSGYIPIQHLEPPSITLGDVTPVPTNSSDESHRKILKSGCPVMQLQQWHLPVSNPSALHYHTSSISLGKGDKTPLEDMDSCLRGVEKAEVLLWSE